MSIIPHGPVRSALALVIGLAAGVGLYMLFFQGQGHVDDVRADTLPDMALETLAGERHPLAGLTADGPAVFTVFASWCRYCKPVMRKAQQLEDLATRQGVGVYAVNYGETPQAAQRAADDLQLTMPVLLDERREFAHALGIDGIPMVLGVARGGEIRYADHVLPPSGEWDAFLALLR